MANQLVLPPDFEGGPAAIFGAYDPADDLGAAITAGYPVMGYRGKVWAIKYQQNEFPLKRNDGSGDPLNSIDVVILAAPNHLSKVWYEQPFQEGSSTAPDCASSNSIVPDLGVPKKQSDFCAPCKWNAFGSRPTIPGQTPTKGKACGDNKRIAIVPLNDLLNERFGGIMLLRVPAASLNDILAYGNLCKQIGFPYYAVGTRISFDTTVSYPKFIFKPIRKMTAEEGVTIMALKKDDIISKIINGDPAPVPNQPQLAASVAVPQTAQAKPDNVVPMQQPTPPTQQSAPVEATGFGGSIAAPAKAPASAAPTQKTASAGAFGGGAEDEPSSPPEGTGVVAFDKDLDAQIEGMIGT